MTPSLHWPTATAALAGCDPVLASLIQHHPTTGLVSRGDAFTTLVRAIVGQQISVKAADAVWARLTTLSQLTPQALQRLSPEALRSVGLSGQKIRYIHGLSAGFVQGTVQPAAWANLPDDAIIAQLTQLPGIGRWTSEMFLIFNLLRPNVLPLDDLGLLKAVQQHYPQAPALGPHAGLAKWRPVQGWLKAYAQATWQPYCSVATWYLWRATDPTEVAY